MSVDEPAPRLTPEQFIEIVYRDVYRSAVDGSVKLMESPPGRRPEQLLGFEHPVHLVVRSAEGEYDLAPDTVELHDLFRGAVDEGG